MTPSLELRDLREENADSLVAFRCTQHGGAAGTALLERQVCSGRVLRAAQHVPDGRALGAIVDERVVACCFIEPMPALPIPADVKGALFVRLFAVHDDHQGRDVDGVGRVSDRLLDHVHEVIVDEVGSPAALALRVEPANERAAAFHARHDYLPVPTESGPPFHVRHVRR